MRASERHERQVLLSIQNPVTTCGADAKPTKRTVPPASMTFARRTSFTKRVIVGPSRPALRTRSRSDEAPSSTSHSPARFDGLQRDPQEYRHLSADIEPPCAATIVGAIGRPMPASFFVNSASMTTPLPIQELFFCDVLPAHVANRTRGSSQPPDLGVTIYRDLQPPLVIGAAFPSLFAQHLHQLDGPKGPSLRDNPTERQG